MMCDIEKLKEENNLLKVENDVLRQYRGSKQASYQNMAACWQLSEKARRNLEKENRKLKNQVERYKRVSERLFNRISLYERELKDIKNICRKALTDINIITIYDGFNKIISKVTEIIKEV